MKGFVEVTQMLPSENEDGSTQDIRTLVNVNAITDVDTYCYTRHKQANTRITIVGYSGSIFVKETYEEVKSMIADAFAVHAHWIGKGYDVIDDGGRSIYSLFECSNCGEEYRLLGLKRSNGEEDTLPTCCPKCKAKMDKEWEDNFEEE